MRRSALSYAVVVLAVSLTAGCRASVPGAGPERPDQQWITREQIAEPRFSSAYDVVRALRSNWLSARGIASLRVKVEVQVYLDGVHLGGPQTLQGISTPAIQYIRYFNGTDATTRWGIGHGRGVIYIGTGPMPEPDAPPPRASLLWSADAYGVVNARARPWPLSSLNAPAVRHSTFPARSTTST